MKHIPEVGKIIKTEECRDAIHVAIAPVVAACDLVVGAPIGFIEPGSNKVHWNTKTSIGIVDPFLKKMVRAGDRFWMFLYPDTITSLRHDWSHPDFLSALSPSADDKSEKAQSENWLRDFCDRHGEICYDEMLSKFQTEDGYAIQYGSGSVQDERVSDEFRKHFKRVTGQEVERVFRCSC